MPKVTFYVVQAFDMNDDGELIGHEPQSVGSASLARRTAETLATAAAGVIAWSRDGDPDVGEYGEPTILFNDGLLPDDLTVIVVPTTDGFAVHCSPDTAEHNPDYRELKSFGTRSEAEDFADGIPAHDQD